MKPVIIITIAIVLTLLPISVFGQSSIVVTTDKASYSEGEIILVTGEVAQLLEGYKIAFTVIGPNGNLVALDQLTVGADKKFSISLAAGGALMKTEGTYTITIQYGSNSNNSAKTSFEFGGSTVTPPSEVESNVQVEGSQESIKFSGLQSIVKNMQVDKDALSIVISMNVEESGTFTIEIPRAVLDATMNDRDIGFFVLVDGVDVKYSETKSTAHRKLTIPYTSGVQEIEIIGTFVVGGANTYSTSEPKPEQIMCTQQYDPVCGVDGRTYGNQCTLNSNGIELDYTGECLKFEPTTKRELEELGIASFVEKSKDPQYYIDRYNNEPSYKEWFDDNYSEYDSIEQAVGLELTAKIPDWVKNIFLWYGQDQISEDELLDAIKYLINEGILIVD